MTVYYRQEYIIRRRESIYLTVYSWKHCWESNVIYAWLLFGFSSRFFLVYYQNYSSMHLVEVVKHCKSKQSYDRILNGYSLTWQTHNITLLSQPCLYTDKPSTSIQLGTNHYWPKNKATNSLTHRIGYRNFHLKLLLRYTWKFRRFIFYNNPKSCTLGHTKSCTLGHTCTAS